MAYMITVECINCHACCEDCPTNAIREGDYYSPSKIDPNFCNECESIFDFPACLEVCPINAIVPNPVLIETKYDLIKKGKYIKTKLGFFNYSNKILRYKNE